MALALYVRGTVKMALASGLRGFFPPVCFLSLQPSFLNVMSFCHIVIESLGGFFPGFYFSLFRFHFFFISITLVLF